MDGAREYELAIVAFGLAVQLVEHVGHWTKIVSTRNRGARKRGETNS